MFEQSQRGVCLVSYRPEHITGVSPDDVDVVILTPGLEPEQVARMAKATGRTPQHIAAMLTDASLGEGIIIEPTTPPDQIDVSTSALAEPHTFGTGTSTHVSRSTRHCTSSSEREEAIRPAAQRPACTSSTTSFARAQTT